MSNEQTTQTTLEPETRSGGVEHSRTQAQGRSKPASPAELALALEQSQQTIAELKRELAASKSSDGIDRLAEVLASALKPTVATAGPTEVDNLNRTSDFRNSQVAVDGRSLMEAQQTLQMFRNEPKKPISVPKAMANTVGPCLSITVNGVRVSIPCDGKTYMINESHWEHARERLAKLDLLSADTEPQIVEVG